jgi:hypothetical protein
MAAPIQYFILKTPLPELEIKRMMGRIVLDITSPLQGSFAPFPPLDPNEELHEPQDIIPSICPQPRVTSDHRSLIQKTSVNKLQTSLTQYLALDFGRMREERLEMESAVVREYSLQNPKDLLFMAHAEPTLRTGRHEAPER